MRALLEGRDNNPAHEEFFNSLISGLKKKNQCWDRNNPVFNLLQSNTVLTYFNQTFLDI